MKTKVLLLSLACSMLCLSSCNEKKKTRLEKIQEFRSELTAADTTEMLSIADNAMEALKAKKIDAVLSSLYEYTDSTGEVKPITEATKKSYQRMFKLFPVLDYKRVYFSFMLEGCNDVKYNVTFATAEMTGDAPATTAYMFNPVKIDGDWKLCVKTPADLIDPEHK